MNKLGMPEYLFEEMEKELVKLKLNSLNEYFTFNCENIDFEYLKALNHFLFIDLYKDEYVQPRKLDEEEIRLMNVSLSSVANSAIDLDYTAIFKELVQIWQMQPFKVGNTRTLVGYLIVIDKLYGLQLNITPVERDIQSGISIFEDLCGLKRKHK